MLRVVEDFAAWTLFDDLAGVHDANAIAQRTNDAEVVSNHQHGCVGLFAQHAHEIEHFGLDRCIETGGGFVEHQQLWIASQGHRDNHALLHATRQLERIAIHHALGVGDTNSPQCFKRVVHSVGLRATEQREALDELAPNLDRWVHCLCRILVDHRGFGGTEMLQLRASHVGDIVAVNEHSPTQDLAIARQVAHRRIRSGGLTAATLANKSVGLARRNRERNAA